MATRRKKRRKSHAHRSVAAPRRRTKRRKRTMGSQPSVIGSPRRRTKHRHSMQGGHKKRRRMGASGGGRSSGGVGEYFGLMFGTGLGLFAAEITGGAIARAVGPGMGTSIGLAIGKIGVSAATFAVGKGPMNNNAFVKGIGIGVGGSAANDGFRALQGAGVVSGPGQVVCVEIRDRGNVRQLHPGNQQQAQEAVPMNGVPVMGESDAWHEAHVVNGQ